MCAIYIKQNLSNIVAINVNLNRKSALIPTYITMKSYQTVMHAVACVKKPLYMYFFIGVPIRDLCNVIKDTGEHGTVLAVPLRVEHMRNSLGRLIQEFIIIVYPSMLTNYCKLTTMKLLASAVNQCFKHVC